MNMPRKQVMRIGTYLMSRRLRGDSRFPLLVELEPLFACNLACAGCGKIQQPRAVLRRRMPVEQALAAVEESGAPMVSIAGGEPLMHPEIDVMVAEFVRRKILVFLCTNGMLLSKKLDAFTPSPYFAFTVHIDGMAERHDATVGRSGVFDRAVAGLREARDRGFRVTTNSTFFAGDSPHDVIEVLDFLNDDVRVDEMMISPGYAFENAPDPDNFLGNEATRELFRAALADGRRERWRLNHSPLFLDFLQGRADLDCTAWGIPSYSVLGWQRPCYLLADGYVETYRELADGTDWSAYGRGRDPRCDNCMAHCGYEPTAVLATMSSPRQSVRALLGG